MSKDLTVQNYEHNVKMHYEAKRKELDILLTSSIPSQLSNMKTILWINFLMIGLILQFIKKIPLSDLLIGFFILSLCAILCILVAMLKNRTKSYGVPEDLELMNSYDSTDEWIVFRATKDMMYALQESIKENRKVIIERAKLMHLSTWFTFFSLVLIIISFTLKQLNL